MRTYIALTAVLIAGCETMQPRTAAQIDAAQESEAIQICKGVKDIVGCVRDTLPHIRLRDATRPVVRQSGPDPFLLMGLSILSRPRVPVAPPPMPVTCHILPLGGGWTCQ